MDCWNYKTSGDRGQIVATCSACGFDAWYGWYEYIVNNRTIKIYCKNCYEDIIEGCDKNIE